MALTLFDHHGATAGEVSAVTAQRFAAGSPGPVVLAISVLSALALAIVARVPTRI